MRILYLLPGSGDDVQYRRRGSRCATFNGEARIAWLTSVLVSTLRSILERIATRRKRRHLSAVPAHLKSTLPNIIKALTSLR
jgi:hypothetical protein